MIQFKGSLESALDKLKASKQAKTVTAPTGGPTKTAPRSVYAQSQVIYTQPQFYSPLHTPQNWQIPQKRREVYQWARYFYENEPKVAAAINYYSQFPINGFETQCSDSAIKSYFDNVNKKLNLDYWLKLISKEYYMLGDAFPFLEVACDVCHGSGVDRETGEACNHPGGTFRRLVLMNPDWIDVQTSVLAEDPVITLLPDDELRKIVWHKRPKPIYDKLPANIRQLILTNRPIPLANESVSHLKHDPYGYGTYGISLIRRLFKMLMYKDKLMTAQWIVAERLILPIRVVKVGDADRPAGPADIADVQAQLASVANDPNLTLVTHHAFDYDWIGANGKVLQITQEFEFINKEILQGLMINDALLSGEMGAYQSSAIGAEGLIQRMESWRLELSRWIEDKVYKPIAQMRGFIDEEASKEIGEPVWVYPKVQWNDLNIRDDTQQKQLYNQLHDKGSISTQTLLEKFGLDYDQETVRIRFETAATQSGPFGQQPGMAGGGGGMGGMPPMGGGGGEMGGMPPEAGGMPMPGMEGGMPGGAPGGMPMPGGAPPMGGAPMGGAPGGVAGTQGKVLKRGKQKQNEAPEEAEAVPQGVRLTSLEQTMWKTIVSMRLPFHSFAQYPMGPYKADFAIPAIRLAIEIDGEYWHKNPEDKAHDEVRDQALARYGWTVLRFGEVELKERMELVKKTIGTMVLKSWRRIAQEQEKASKNAQATGSMLEQMFKTAEPDHQEEDKPIDGQADSGTGHPLG